MTINLLVGSDPEIWIKDNTTGKLISADGLFPGTKEEPHKVMHGAIQVDGMAAEFNTLPAKNANQFVLHHLSVLRSLRDSIKENNPNLDFSFVFDPVAEFGAEYIQSQPEHARRLGCTPDYDGYNNGAANPAPDADMPFRTASGHIHIGWGEDYDIADSEHVEACTMMARQMDWAMGGLLREEGEAGKKRRQLYGKAGAFRPKSYGVEYRSSSNVWLRYVEHISTAFKNTERVFNELMAGTRWYEMYESTPNWINEHNEYYAADYLPTYRNFKYRGGGTAVTMESLDRLFFEYIFADEAGNYDVLSKQADEFYKAQRKPVTDLEKYAMADVNIVGRAPWAIRPDAAPMAPPPAVHNWVLEPGPINDMPNVMVGRAPDLFIPDDLELDEDFDDFDEDQAA